MFRNRHGSPNIKKIKLSHSSLVDIKPLYSPVYLPRKFKFNNAVAPYNNANFWSSDVGLITSVDPDTDKIVGYNMEVGGCMDTTQNNKKTYPRRGSWLGFIKPEDIITAIRCAFIVQRDNGSRTDRKHARMKDTINDMGIDVFKGKVEKFLGKKFGPEKPFEIKSSCNYFGYVKDEKG